MQTINSIYKIKKIHWYCIGKNQNCFTLLHQWSVIVAHNKRDCVQIHIKARTLTKLVLNVWSIQVKMDVKVMPWGQKVASLLLTIPPMDVGVPYTDTTTCWKTRPKLYMKSIIGWGQWWCRVSTLSDQNNDPWWQHWQCCLYDSLLPLRQSMLPLWQTMWPLWHTI